MINKSNVIEDVVQDLFETDCEVICHQVNCMGRMSSGVALGIKNRFPEVYKSFRKTYKKMGSDILGGCSLIKLKEPRGTVTHVANIYGQYAYIGSHKEDKLLSLPVWNSPDFFNGFTFRYTTTPRFTNYEAVTRGLEKLRYDMTSANLSSLAIPYRMGADRGKGDWKIIRSIIESVFSTSNIKVKVYHLLPTVS